MTIIEKRSYLLLVKSALGDSREIDTTGFIDVREFSSCEASRYDASKSLHIRACEAFVRGVSSALECELGLHMSGVAFGRSRPDTYCFVLTSKGSSPIAEVESRVVYVASFFGDDQIERGLNCERSADGGCAYGFGTSGERGLSEYPEDKALCIKGRCFKTYEEAKRFIIADIGSWMNGGW